MHPIVRVILGVVTGVIASFVIVLAVEAICFVAFPLRRAPVSTTPRP